MLSLNGCIDKESLYETKTNDNTIYNPGYAVTPFFNTVPVDLYVR